ncbi:MAG: phage tail assembly protein [Nostoc sp. S4]|nr:phage tail assembly protein [Nostoc sp. S4]
MQQTEFRFTLPQGYIDPEGNIHQEGIMRLASAYDKIAPIQDPRVQANPSYFVIILLSRVIVRLGTMQQINPKVIENLFSADLVYLQDLYQRINQNGHNRFLVECPHCGGQFHVEPPQPGE